MTGDFKPRAAALIFTLATLASSHAATALAPLEGRTITGAKVDAYDPRAVMEYDPNMNLTWLRDWNASGPRSWAGQLAWASNLQVGSFANWSLPTSRNPDGSGPCALYNCTGSQMGYLFYEVLGNTDHSFTNAGPFQNIQHYGYWSGTADAEHPGSAWFFHLYDADTVGNNRGFQWRADQTAWQAAVAVRPGDVAATVPEPASSALMLAGLATVALGAAARAKRRGGHAYQSVG